MRKNMEPEDDKTRTHIVLTKGTMVAHYRIIEKIGAGGMGEVYLAEDTELGRRVALKFLPPHLCQDDDCRARFKREAQAVAKLSHPNVVTIYEVSEHHGRPFFAMEHIEGRSLRDVIKGKELTLDQAVNLAAQICEGLNKAHQAGIIHRDIKPSNIVIDTDGRAKLLDFGLATVVGTDKLTKTGSTLGTVGYMSPEQAKGQKVDARSDLFSLGVVLYEMITGRTPFARENDVATAQAIVSAIPEPLAKYRSNVSDDLQRMVSKLLEKDPAYRYQSAAGVTSDLKRLIAPTQSSIAVTPARRPTRWPLWASAGVVTAIAVVAWYSFWITKQASEVSMPTEESALLTHLSELPTVAVLYLDNLSESNENDFFADGMTEDIITDLSNISGLRVMSRQDVRKYRGQQANIATIGKELNVDYVMEGSVRRSGNQLRLTAQLIKVADGFHVWAERFDRDLQDVFAVQAEISHSIAEALSVRLTQQERQIVERAPTSNISAYDLYLKGRQRLFERSKEDNIKAERLFRQAIAQDNNYALAYTGLARIFLQRVDWGFDNDRKWLTEAKILFDKTATIDSTPAELYNGLGLYYLLISEDSLAIAAHKRAVAIRPHDYYHHYSLAYCLYSVGRWERAEEELRISLDLKQDHADPYRWLASIALYSGKPEEAKRYVRKAVELAPNAAHILSWAQRVYFPLGDLPRAEWYARETVRLKPETPGYVGRLGVLELFNRNLTEAIAHLRAGTEGAKSADLFEYLGWAYQLSGDRLQADEAFRNALRQATANLRTDSTNIMSRYLLLIARTALGDVTDPEPELRRLAMSLRDQNLQVQTLAWLQTAVIRANVEDYNRALDELRKILDSKVYSANYIAAHPAFEGLKTDPRFQALIEKYEKEHEN